MNFSPLSADRAETDAVVDQAAAADGHTRAALRLELRRIGDATVIAARGGVDKFPSRVYRLGYERPVTGDAVAGICEWLEETAIPRAVFTIDPLALPDDWAEICTKLNISAGPRMIKLATTPGVVLTHAGQVELDPSLRVALVGRNRAREWATATELATETTPAAILALRAASIGRPGWRAVAAFDGDRIVATGKLHVHGDTGYLMSDTTIPGYRNRGAQTALLVERARLATETGCRWLVVDTDGPGTALNNLLRLGFEQLYERPQWLWQAAGS
ncbi:GNAT family N-acetyltransferase [Amycolatopsis sp. GM8]|uniref:GNAT family N-acetyltransferase n=1 Tax=Amycolatopsis sp. GM8 TaxID=2896530 RepID=UPI001F189941|nr:GNAT family N-acetyltransferase [Amycolatopsis sp. GM8]